MQTPRDQKVLQTLRKPKTSEDIWELNLFPSKQTMYRRLSHFRHKRLIHTVGMIATKGRPQEIVCTKKMRAGVHELEVSRFLDSLGCDHSWGGAHEADGTLHLDADVFVEWDRGTESMIQVESRLRKFHYADGFVLFMTVSESRAHRVLDRCSFLGNRLITGFDNTVLYRRGNLLQTCLQTLLKKLQQNQHPEVA